MSAERIINKIIDEMDVDDVAEKLAEGLLADDSLVEHLSKKILDTFGDSYRGSNNLETTINNRIADKVVDKFAGQVLAKIDIEALTNAVTLKAADAFKDRMR
jgi:phage host-nuclease inhibitor protein Gam